MVGFSTGCTEHTYAKAMKLIASLVPEPVGEFEDL